jgi:hypothetical protein
MAYGKWCVETQMFLDSFEVRGGNSFARRVERPLNRSKQYPLLVCECNTTHNDHRKECHYHVMLCCYLEDLPCSRLSQCCHNTGARCERNRIMGGKQLPNALARCADEKEPAFRRGECRAEQLHEMHRTNTPNVFTISAGGNIRHRMVGCNRSANRGRQFLVEVATIAWAGSAEQRCRLRQGRVRGYFSLLQPTSLCRCSFGLTSATWCSTSRYLQQLKEVNDLEETKASNVHLPVVEPRWTSASIRTALCLGLHATCKVQCSVVKQHMGCASMGSELLGKNYKSNATLPTVLGCGKV